MGRTSRPRCVSFPPPRRGGGAAKPRRALSSSPRSHRSRIPVRLDSDQPTRDRDLAFPGSTSLRPHPPAPPSQGGETDRTLASRAPLGHRRGGPQGLVLVNYRTSSSHPARTHDRPGSLLPQPRGLTTRAATRREAGLTPRRWSSSRSRVRPILVERCQGCHGPAKQKGGCGSTRGQAILTGGTPGRPSCPGSPREPAGRCDQLRRALPDAAEVEAPRRGDRGPDALGQERGHLGHRAGGEGRHGDRRQAGQGRRIWRALGEFARRARYWCFQPITQVDPPEISTATPDWPRNPIDRFILAALEERGLSPAPEADRRTLIRRLTFDLIGLPPTPGRGRRVPGRRRARRLRDGWSTGCWPARTTASGGGGTGSTWPGTPRPPATSSTTTSSTPSDTATT